MNRAKPTSARKAPWTSWDAWLSSPPGKYVLEWEQAQFDHIVSDIFGYHALQIGLPQLLTLQENRMPLQIILRAPHDKPNQDDSMEHTWHAVDGIPEELPFTSQSLDLVILPHVLEFASDPHAVLREVERVLMPEGRVVISGFNPASLWGLRQYLSHILGQTPYLPREGQFIALLRIKDWLKLLNFSVDRGRFGCYRLPLRSKSGMKKMGFLEKAGDRWWPVLGSVFIVSAVKRVSGMTLVGKIDSKPSPTSSQLSPATNLTSPQRKIAQKDIHDS
ncbi:class I SAM-dependent methyltransferase [Polynucleobacter sp. MWH-Spelu-300-X4]|uniref:class I SAM-dependent methyltransferase n=1 Tax=Polynucleobacter sp. MWH-Spelu-300-X4 TaxID=2689109 RepID=UPI001BFDD28C|nr:class I SAM-dependent methyltransferase [Polynucleobacter sp. MWH-Spelu-300-X4]QWD79285.1 class I SAM-dependent methyltransferase [Polynucleobacter sp. MWH-Spelu-300-X4]